MIFKVTQSQKTFNSSKFVDDEVLYTLEGDEKDITIQIDLPGEVSFLNLFGEDFDLGDEVEVTIKKV